MNTLPDRRSFLATSLLAAPALAATSTIQNESARRPLKVVCVGGHPDDPESGCGGTLALFTAAGHNVSIVYLTRGERGIDGKSLDEAARIRTSEAHRACEILKAVPVFAGQIDGATELTANRVRAFIELLTEERPDIVLTHWPVDTHMDHQVASLLVFRAWLAARQSFSLFYFEVNAGEQTRLFLPTEYVDITPVRDQKKRALFAHVSQDGEAIYRDHHGPMEEFRGREIGVAAAEAFVHAARPHLLST
jgi:LmbE family N-acetylglucosaminyl deacetylase